MAALLSLLPFSAGNAAPVDAEHLTVELVAESTALAPGDSAWLGLRLKHDPHWHTYWINPGDSGLPTKLAWRVPPGYAVDEIAWPAPQRLRVGELHNFGYDGEMLLPVRVTVPAGAQPGERASFALDANWLVCEEECIPGKATLSLDLPIAAAPAPDPRWQALFAAAHAAQPQAVDWTGAATAHGDAVEIRLTGANLPPLEALDAFAVPEQVLANTAMTFARDGDALVATAARSEYFDKSKMPQTLDLVVVSRAEGVRAWRTRVAWREVEKTTAAASAPPAPVAPHEGGLAFALAFALLGGVLLNLMPCVFPVLSLKALGLAEGAHAPGAARRDGLAYLAGTVAGFVALAGVLLVLRGAGQSLGWGFQLQSPTLVAALMYLMLAMGLSLSGVYVVGARWSGTGQRLTEGGGVRAAFFTGVLACVVASPCTAPFMGPALGYALTQPAWAALAVFAALGVGLALPIVALGFVPLLARWLPRPGAWMETLKQVLAFPLYLTAVWLFWVLMRQVGADAAALVLAGAVVLVGALVWHGRAQFAAPRVLRRVAIAALVLVAVVPLADLKPQAATHAGADAAWQPWDAGKLDALRQEGAPVLVNMTAAWCITCLANERVALSSDTFREALRNTGTRYLKGDWTNQDAAITTYLAGFGRSGVPLYVLYPRGGGAPEVLPQILTPGLVADALARAAAGPATPATRSSP